MTVKVKRDGGVKVIDSYMVFKKDFEMEIKNIIKMTPGLEVWKRSVKSLKLEWATHSLLYNLGIKRNKTADVDFDYPQKWYMKAGYWIIGNLALIFIR